MVYLSWTVVVLSIFRDDQPKEYVRQQSWYASRDESDQEGQPEPESADPKEFSQPAANPCDYTVRTGSP